MKQLPLKQASATEIDSILDSLRNDFRIPVRDLTSRLSEPTMGYMSQEMRCLRLLVESAHLEDATVALRERLRSVGWLVTQVPKRRSILVIAPMTLVSVQVGYHSTKQEHLAAIMRQGLLPNSPDRSNTKRIDCTGNIYLCTEFGHPMADLCSEPEKGTAHWWSWTLGGGDVAGQCIISVDLGRIDALVYRDPWSASGIIVVGIDCLPPEVISVIWNPK